MNNLSKSDLAVTVTDKSVTVTLHTTGESFIINDSDPRFSKLKKCIKDDRWHEVPSYLSGSLFIEQQSNGNMRVKNNRVYVTLRDGREWCVPVDLNNTILEYMNHVIPFMPLVNFAINLAENPDQNAVYGLFQFIEKNNITITQNGNFIAYKGVTYDYKDLRTRTMDNSHGATVEEPREVVNSNPAETCSRGLHVASWDYAHKGYGGEKMIFVEVNPRDVVSVPREYGMAKLRVCRYKVLGDSDGNIDKPLYLTNSEKQNQSATDAQRGAMPLRD